MYKSEDFKKCLFNPMSTDLFAEYEQLREIKSISKAIDNKLMKFIIAVYDYNSPIVSKYRDLKIRKQQGAEFAGYDVLSEDAKKIFNLDEDYIVEAVDKFLKKMIHNRTWYMICANESIFWEYGKRMLMPIGGTEEEMKKMSEKDLIAAMQAKTKLSEDMQSIDDRIDTGYKRLYGDENIGRFMNRSLTPERVALERQKYA